MRENAVFTIVTKGYLPQARTLGDSLRRLDADLAFHVMLADEPQGMIDLSCEQYHTEEVRSIGIPTYRQMAFQYSLVEFCTAVKPFCFEYLFERFGYQKMVYLDPDIFVYSDLGPIFALLGDDASAVLTPHITKIDLFDKGTKPQDDYLRCGTYNLGFIALDHSEEGMALLRWWKSRTESHGYTDVADGLYVDQKWANLMPSISGRVHISRHAGLNVAHWNMHERELTKQNGAYYVDGLPLVFFHFSGFDANNASGITRPHARSIPSIGSANGYSELFDEYRTRLIGHLSPDVASYAFSNFENGTRIFHFQRRMYRTLREHGLEFGDPFSTAPGSYYDLLRRNKLLIKAPEASGEFRKEDITRSAAKLALLKSAMLFLKKLIGIRHYHLLLRVLVALSRPEEQTFLIETLGTDYPLRFRG